MESLLKPEPGFDGPGLPMGLLAVLQQVASEVGIKRLALVGGAVRDGLLHRVHFDPWRGLPDLDLVVFRFGTAIIKIYDLLHLL